ncbi:MAG: GAF domain-containing protein [Cyanobacteria bacterium Co-bin8]|nr:GAF domain-containing protein [Cyanobacteria bacterium Co-bin8]
MLAPALEPFLLPAQTSLSLAAHQHALASVIAHIRGSLNLDTIFQTTATQVRQLLGADRVGVFRFFPDHPSEGALVAEDVAEGVRSVLAQPIQDHCFSDRFAPLYKEGRINAVSDFENQNLEPCYLDLMRSLQVRANIVAPLLVGSRLWGLLCIHQCRGPRQWQPTDIEFVRQIADHLSMALHHADLLQQARAQTEQQRALAAVIARIRNSLNLDKIFQTTATEVRQLLEADRVGVFQFSSQQDWAGHLVAEDVAPGWRSALAEPIEDNCFGERFAALYQEGRINAVSDFDTDAFEPCYRSLMAHLQVQANIVAPLINGKTLWGLLCIHQCRGPRQWQPTEIEFVRQISEHLSIALQQAGVIEQVQQQSAQLAEAAARHRSAERHRALATTIDKIRQSLDIDTIFQTATAEVLHLLETERTVIYRFNADWSGEFVAESMTPGWLALMKHYHTHADSCLQQNQGGRYRHNEPHAVADIFTAGYADCHIAMLEAFQARAFMIAPILQGNQLWGLLATYQNSGPRQWEAHELYLLSQVGTQLGVALQQAEYVRQVQHQANQLQRAAEREKAVAKTVDRIRQSLDIATIFETTTQEVRLLLGVERVAIYRFHSDWSGEFVADSIEHDWQPAQAPVLPAYPSLPGQSAQPYPRHETFVPILQGDRLWGLLMAYQSAPRHWPEDDIALLAQLGTQLGMALQQAELWEQTRAQKEELTHTLATLQRSQTRLIQSEKMAGLGQLVAGVAHEINNPINFIAGNLAPARQYADDLLQILSLYQQECTQPSRDLQRAMEAADLDFLRQDLPKTLASMSVGTERIRQIVLSLRNFSRLDQAEMKPVNLHEGLDSTLLILHHRFKDRPELLEIELVKQYGELPLVECYPAQLNQVFMNVLSNSIDALRERQQQSPLEPDYTPQICLQTKQVKTNWVRIRVTDNGLGIRPEIQHRLFDPFFTTKDPGKGTGLGLSISYQIVVEKHGGQLYYAPRAGGGTEFTIEVPVQQPSFLK